MGPLRNRFSIGNLRMLARTLQKACRQLEHVRQMTERTDADAEEHCRHELQRNVGVEQRRARVAGAGLDQAVHGAAHSAAGNHRVAQSRAQLQVCTMPGS